MPRRAWWVLPGCAAAGAPPGRPSFFAWFGVDGPCAYCAFVVSLLLLQSQARQQMGSLLELQAPDGGGGEVAFDADGLPVETMALAGPSPGRADRSGNGWGGGGGGSGGLDGEAAVLRRRLMAVEAVRGGNWAAAGARGSFE